MERRLRVETDPAMLLELREALDAMQRGGTSHPSGIAYQESRLPPIDGPDDCFDCHTVIGDIVPVSWQRIFEDGLRITGLSPEAVWEMREYRTPRELIGHGHGQVAICRPRHAEHIESYLESKAASKDDGDSRTMF